METYDKGITSLPYEIICEIFSLLDVEELKSCSLTGKALSYLAKPFIHRTLHLTHRSGYSIPDRWNGFEGLPTLGKRGLLQHTRHILIVFPHDPRLAQGLDSHIQHLRTLTNLRSLKAHCLDTPSFIPEMEEYFGSFFGTLQSLELVLPMGGHKQIVYFACQFPNLRDLKISGNKLYTDSVHSGDDPHFDIKTSPPLDGTLDLQWYTDVGPGRDPIGAHFILGDLVALPSGPKFRTLKLSGCTSNNLQLLLDKCAPTLECAEFTGGWFGVLFLHRGELSFVHLCSYDLNIRRFRLSSAQFQTSPRVAKT